MYTWLPLNSPADLAQLEELVSGEYAPKRVADQLTGGVSSAVKGVLIERNYVDKDYRSTYYKLLREEGPAVRTRLCSTPFF